MQRLSNIIDIYRNNTDCLTFYVGVIAIFLLNELK